RSPIVSPSSPEPRQLFPPSDERYTPPDEGAANITGSAAKYDDSTIARTGPGGRPAPGPGKLLPSSFPTSTPLSQATTSDTPRRPGGPPPAGPGESVAFVIADERALVAGHGQRLPRPLDAVDGRAEQRG